MIADANASTAAEACSELEHISSPGRVGFLAVDVSVPDDVEAMASECVNQFGRLDVLVNNAAIFPFQLITAMTPEPG